MENSIKKMVAFPTARSQSIALYAKAHQHHRPEPKPERKCRHCGYAEPDNDWGQPVSRYLVEDDVCSDCAPLASQPASFAEPIHMPRGWSRPTASEQLYEAVVGIACAIGNVCVGVCICAVGFAGVYFLFAVTS